jgi:hypothetical protein
MLKKVLLPILGLVLIAALAVVATMPIGVDSLLWRELQNWLHILFFAGLAIVLLLLFRRFLYAFLRQPSLHYLLALGLSAMAGVISEALQYPGPRDADFGDLLRDLVGVTAGLGIAQYFDTRIRPRRRWLQLARKITGAAAFAFILITLLPSAKWSLAYWQRDRAFPVIHDFDSYWMQRFLAAQSAEITSGEPDSACESLDAKTIGRIELRQGQYPGFTIADPVPDWSGYSHLSFSVCNTTSVEIKLCVRIDDELHEFAPEDRFVRCFGLAPGLNRIEIPLEEVAEAPAGRRMDLARIARVIVFVPDLKTRSSLVISDLKLKSVEKPR